MIIRSIILFLVVARNAETVSFTVFVFLSVTSSTKSTNFGSRYLVEGFSEGTKFGSLIEGALLYLTTQISKLWRRGSVWALKD